MFGRLFGHNGPAPPAPPWHLKVSLWKLAARTFPTTLDAGFRTLLGEEIPLLWASSEELAQLAGAGRPIVDEYDQIPGYRVEVSVLPEPSPAPGWRLDEDDDEQQPASRHRASALVPALLVIGAIAAGLAGALWLGMVA